MPNIPSNVSVAKPNSGKIKIESNEGKVPEALQGMNFTTEQLPPLDNSEGYVPSVTEVKGEEKQTTLSPTEKRIEETPEVEEKKEVEVKEEVPKPEGELTEKKEEGVERFLKPPKGSKAREDIEEKKKFDLSEFDPKEQDILKKMPKENVPAVMKLIRDNKEYVKTQQNQFFQSPEGYLLHPGYRAEISAITLAEKEAKEWSRMLKDVKAGIAIKPLVGWNRQTGEPIYGDEVNASDDIEETLRNNFNQCLAVANEKRVAVNNFVKNFPQLAANDMKVIQAERVNRFAWVANPKLLDHEINIEGTGDKSIRQIKTDTSSLFPVYMRGNEAVEVCGDLMVALMIAKAELNESKKGKRAESTKKEEEKSFEPRGDIKPKTTGTSTHGVTMFSTDYAKQAGIEI